MGIKMTEDQEPCLSSIIREQLKQKESRISMVILSPEGATKSVEIEREKEQDIWNVLDNFVASEFVWGKLCSFSSYELKNYLHSISFSCILLIFVLFYSAQPSFVTIDGYVLC